MPNRNGVADPGEIALSGSPVSLVQGNWSASNPANTVSANSVDPNLRNDATNELIARGHVVARYQNHSLRAEELIYNTETGRVVANGHAEVVNPDGTVEYGEPFQAMDAVLRRPQPETLEPPHSLQEKAPQVPAPAGPNVFWASLSN